MSKTDRLVNTVLAGFNTIMRQMTKMSQQKTPGSTHLQPLTHLSNFNQLIYIKSYQPSSLKDGYNLILYWNKMQNFIFNS